MRSTLCPVHRVDLVPDPDGGHPYCPKCMAEYERRNPDRVKALMDAARDVLLLEWPKPGSEEQHPAKGMDGPGKWRRLRHALERAELERR